MESAEDRDNVPEDRDHVPEEQNLIDLDQILEEEVGEFGTYQIVSTALISLLIVFFSMAWNEYDFTAAQIPHRCRIPECEGSFSNLLVPEFSPSWLLNAINGTSSYSFENCTRFINISSESPVSGSCPAEWFNRTGVVKCDEYVYEHIMGAVYDFGLACDEWRRTIMKTYAVQIGIMLIPMAGSMGDMKGRRPVLIIAVFLAACFGFARSFVTSYVGFVVLRVIQITLGSGVFSLCYVLGMESIGPNYRVLAGAILSSMIPLGQIVLALLAWAVPWRTLLLIIFTPQLLVIGYFWIILESVRWLISKEQYTLSEAVIRKLAKFNKRQLSHATLKDFQVSAATSVIYDKKAPSFLTLIWKTPGILRRIGMGLLWYVTYGLIQYTMEETTAHLTQHRYLNHVYVTAFAIAGIWTAALLLDRLGRKIVIIAGFVLCAVCQLAFAFIPQDWSVLFTIVYLLGKFFAAVVMSSTNLYIVELFPTDNRSLFFAYFYMHAVIGGLLGEPVSSLGPIAWMGLPSLLIGCLALISAALVLFGPETRGTKLPDTMEEAAQLGHEDNQIHIPLANVQR